MKAAMQMAGAALSAVALATSATPTFATVTTETGLDITRVAYANGMLLTPDDYLPYAPSDCGFVVQFSDSTPGSSYSVSVSPADIDVEREVSVKFDRASKTGFAYVGCGDDATGKLVSGTAYTLTLEEYGGTRGALVGSVSQSALYEQLSGPDSMSLSIDGAPATGNLPTGVPIDIAYEGQWEEGSTFQTVVAVVPGAAWTHPAGPKLDPRFIRRLGTSTSDAPQTTFTVPHPLGNDYVFASIRVTKPGKAPVVLYLNDGDPQKAVTPPATERFPAAWITSPGVKSGAAWAGVAASVSHPVISTEGRGGQVNAYYQWYLDDVAVQWATWGVYTPPLSALGKRLTLGIEFTAPGYFPRTGTFDFGLVGQRTVPGGWIKTPAAKSGTPRAGSTVSVTGPTLTHTASQSGAKVYFQWFADGRKIPGATSRTYTVPSAARGKTLTVGIAVSMPSWKSLNGTMSFGRVG